MDTGKTTEENKRRRTRSSSVVRSAQKKKQTEEKETKAKKGGGSNVNFTFDKLKQYMNGEFRDGANLADIQHTLRIPSKKGAVNKLNQLAAWAVC